MSHFPRPARAPVETYYTAIVQFHLHGHPNATPTPLAPSTTKMTVWSPSTNATPLTFDVPAHSPSPPMLGLSTDSTETLNDRSPK